MCGLVWILDHVHDENTKVKIKAKTPREHRHTMGLRESECALMMDYDYYQISTDFLLDNGDNLIEDVTIFSNIVKRIPWVAYTYPRNSSPSSLSQVGSNVTTSNVIQARCNYTQLRVIVLKIQVRIL